MSSYPFYHTYVENRFACENTFGARYCQPWPWAHYNRRRPEAEAERMPPGNRPDHWPTFAEARHLLPQPFWAGHDEAIACYWRAWELAFGHFRRATPENLFPSDFSATAFNDSTFMWDSAFIALFGRYGRRAWPFQATLDNFYAKQHPDGFICREIREADGTDRFQRFDPAGTGPNVLAWAEWEHYRHTADRDRLARVFPPLVAYGQWLRRYRTWPNGAYWATGWSSGMDNQPRFTGCYTDRETHRWEGVHEWYDHAHGVWADANFQALLSDRIITLMSEALGRAEEVPDFRAEYRHLGRWVNRHLWDNETGFYHDLDRSGRRQSGVKSIGAYWALLAGIVPRARLNAFLAHLTDASRFARRHCCPSLSADTPGFEPDGGYWRGGVWPPAVYMLLEGLQSVGRSDLAHTIAQNHLDNVVGAFARTGTLWENYAPDYWGEGRSTPDFVGWSGVPPIAVLFEHVFGLRADAPAETLTWDVRLLEEHGVANYPFGPQSRIDLRCERRARPEDEPRIEIQTDAPVRVRIRWAGGQRTIAVSR